VGAIKLCCIKEWLAGRPLRVSWLAGCTTAEQCCLGWAQSPSPVPQITLPNDPLKICNKEKDGEGGRCDRNLVLQAALGKRPRVAASGGSGGSATVAPVFRRWRFSAPLTQYRTFPRLVLGSRVPIQSKASSIAAARPPLLLLLLLLIAARLLPLVLATGAAKDSKHRRSDAARPLILLLHCTARQ
jgi:hypothetical protein